MLRHLGRRRYRHRESAAAGEAPLLCGRSRGTLRHQAARRLRRISRQLRGHEQSAWHQPANACPIVASYGGSYPAGAQFALIAARDGGMEVPDV
jgi:hypothetical protein